MAEKATKNTSPEVTAPEVTVPDPHELVKIRLHMDKKSGKGLYVNVNNHNYFIPRGETCEVPRFIAEVVENSIYQDEATARLIEKVSAEADKF